MTRAFDAGNQHCQRFFVPLLALAQSLHLKTVAEGVETAEQAGRLAELGCDELQGFWISRPLPLDALLDWLRARTPAGV